MISAVLVVGTFGYVLLGLNLGNAIYQTVITVTTVGYREVGLEESNSSVYKLFTAVLILSGTGTVLYTLSVLIELIFDGRINDQLRRLRMQTNIERLNGHIVVCGFGQIGRIIFNGLRNEINEKALQVVVVDRNDYYSNREYREYGVQFWIAGEATEDNSLLRAGVDRASILVLALNSDVDNLYVALTARAMNPDLCIVSRASESSVVPKLEQAGADHVVNPYEIGGSRMAALVLSVNKPKIW